MSKEKTRMQISFALPLADSSETQALATKTTYSGYYIGLLIEQANKKIEKHLDFLNNGKARPVSQGDLEDINLLLNLAKGIAEYLPDYACELERKINELTEAKEEKKPALDLSSLPENLDITAEQFSALINKPDLPKEFQTVLDNYCEVKQ